MQEFSALIAAIMPARENIRQVVRKGKFPVSLNQSFLLSRIQQTMPTQPARLKKRQSFQNRSTCCFIWGYNSAGNYPGQEWIILQRELQPNLQMGESGLRLYLFKFQVLISTKSLQRYEFFIGLDQAGVFLWSEMQDEEEGACSMTFDTDSLVQMAYFIALFRCYYCHCLSIDIWDFWHIRWSVNFGLCCCCCLRRTRYCYFGNSCC